MRKQKPILDTFITCGKYQTKWKYNRYDDDQPGLLIYRPGDTAYFQHKNFRYFCKVLGIHETRVLKCDGFNKYLFTYYVQIINN